MKRQICFEYIFLDFYRLLFNFNSINGTKFKFSTRQFEQNNKLIRFSCRSESKSGRRTGHKDQSQLNDDKSHRHGRHKIRL